MNTIVKIPRSMGFFCPHCGNEPPDRYRYSVSGSEYPIYLNTKPAKFDTLTYYNWDEIHCCNKCDQRFISYRLNLIKLDPKLTRRN